MERHSARRRPGAGILAVTAAVLCLGASTVPAQEPSFEEIVVSFEVPRLLQQDVFVQYDGRTVYLPVVEMLTILDLSIAADFTEKTISGFVIDEKNRFRIDLNTFEVQAREGVYHLLASEFYMGRSDLYVRVDLFEQLFGLPVTFDFSLLRVLMPLSEDLPAYRKLERQAKRKKLQRTKAALNDVLRLAQERDYLKGGVIDWVVGANPLERDGQYYDLSMGGMVLGGDAYIGMAGNSRSRFDTDRFTGRWHYFLDNGPYITQVDVGHVYSTGAFSRRFTGAVVTNRPQTRRKYFQTVEVSGYAGESWEVELYVDRTLVDFVTADARGEYHFTLDIYYGASVMELRMYGPNGEIRTEERYVRIPHNLIPDGEIEYTVALGESSVREQARNYAQASAYYGVFNRLTAGLSADLPVGSDNKEDALVAGEAVLQLANNLTVNGSISPSNVVTGSFSFSEPSRVNLNGSFSKYFENRFRNPLQQDFRLQFAFSVPLRIRDKYFGVRYFVAADRFPSHTSVNMNFGLTASLSPVQVNYMGRYKVTKYGWRRASNFTSQLLISPRFLRWCRPQLRLDYDHTENLLAKYGVWISKRLFRTGQLTLSYERNEMAKANSIMLTFNFFSDFAHFTTRVLHAAGNLSMNQLQRGSVRYDQDDRKLLFDRTNGVGYGTAVVRPYLDGNYNGRYDLGEEYLTGLRARIPGVSGRPRGKDRVYYYERLRPYDEYLLQIDEYSLDDPLLKPTNEAYQVTLNPNVVTPIDVPLVMAGELSGQVRRRLEYGDAGIGGMKLIVVNVSKDIMSEVTTFADGDYYYLGLLPGSYRVYIDPAQLENYGYITQPEAREFKVTVAEGGMSVVNIDFLLLPKTQTSR
ncbi:MAG TPA: hypothetical protein VMY05_02965 [Acidobacteriota bacterium]|nr:hypothetical protein [Acidobacteriota bacterium]